MNKGTALEALIAELLGDVIRLNDEVKELTQSLPGASDTVRQAGRDAAATIQSSIDQSVQGLVNRMVETEATRMQTEFAMAAEKTLSLIRKEACASATSGWKIKVALSMFLVILAAAGAGGVLGYLLAVNSQSLDKETSQNATIEEFLQILPRLSQDDKAKLVKLIQPKQ